MESVSPYKKELNLRDRIEKRVQHWLDAMMPAETQDRFLADKVNRQLMLLYVSAGCEAMGEHCRELIAAERALHPAARPVKPISDRTGFTLQDENTALLADAAALKKKNERLRRKVERLQTSNDILRDMLASRPQ